MSAEQLKTLRDGARHLRDLHADVKAVVFSRRGHEETVFARRTLGDGIEVEPWYLADYFLQQWSDWSGMKSRFARYYGEPKKPFSKALQKLDRDCAALARQVAEDEVLCKKIETHWFSDARLEQDQRDDLDSAVRDAYSTVVQNYRRWTVVSMPESDQRKEPWTAGRATEESDVLRQKQMAPLSESWQRLGTVADRLNIAVVEALQETPAQIRQIVQRFVRNYCHASIIYSWLFDAKVWERFPNWPALLTIQVSGKAMTPSIDRFLEQIDDADAKQTSQRVLDRLTSAISEVGFESVVNDITSGQFHGGPDSPVGSDQVNLIPSDIVGPCKPVLLAVSRGEKKAIGFPAIMRKVREHLIRCPVTKSVIVVCDHWSPTILDEHLGDLRAHHGRGVRFLFMLVGTPDRSMAPVSVDLA